MAPTVILARFIELNRNVGLFSIQHADYDA
jgi:hypothetical protein